MKKVLLKPVIILMSFVLMGDCVVIPIVPDIYAAFPHASRFTHNFIISGPMLIAIPATLICGTLAQFISKKYLLVFAYLIYAIGGIGIAFTHNIYFFVIFRALLGVTFGFLGAAAFGLIGELFDDEKERGSMIGFYNAFMAVSGMVIATASGYIAVSNWHYSFFINFTAIPILILMVFILPQTPPEGKSRQGAGEYQEQKLPYLKVGGLAISAVVFNTMFMILFYFIAVYLQEKQLGDTSTAGIMSSLITAGSFLAGILFSFYYKRLRRYTPATFFLVLGACYFMLSLDVNIDIIGIVTAIAGWSYGLSMSYYYMTATTIVSSGVMTLSASVINASIGLGCYLAPYLLNGYQSLLKVQTLRGIFLYVAMTLGICGVISVILAVRERKMNHITCCEKSCKAMNKGCHNIT